MKNIKYTVHKKRELRYWNVNKDNCLQPHVFMKHEGGRKGEQDNENTDLLKSEPPESVD